MLQLNVDLLKTTQEYTTDTNRTAIQLANVEKQSPSFGSLMKKLRSPSNGQVENNQDEIENPNGEIRGIKVTDRVIIPSFNDGATFQQKKAIADSLVQTFENESKINPQLSHIKFRVVHLSEKIVMIEVYSNKGAIILSAPQIKYYSQLANQILKGVD
jgi:hypothetical protein